jgi:hypothetical protein
MQRIQVKPKAQSRHTTPADPPTINHEIVRIWFAESQLQEIRNSAG